MVKHIEESFFKLLQSDIELTICGKKYKSGKFMNFKVKEFFIQLELIVNGKDRKVIIPHPFKVYDDEDSLVFSYQLEDMGSYGNGVYVLLKNAIGGGRGKLYNKELTIKRIDDE